MGQRTIQPLGVEHGMERRRILGYGERAKREERIVGGSMKAVLTPRTVCYYAVCLVCLPISWFPRLYV